MVENIVGKRENACDLHFLLFPQCFQIVFFVVARKTRHRVLRKVKDITDNVNARSDGIIWTV